MGVNVGNELDGTGKEHDRPVLVLRPFNAETFLASRSLVIRASAVSTSLLAKWKDRDAVANHSQVWLFDTKHLIRKMGTLDERAFRELAKALALTLFSVPGLEIICPA